MGVVPVGGRRRGHPPHTAAPSLSQPLPQALGCMGRPSVLSACSLPHSQDGPSPTSPLLSSLALQPGSWGLAQPTPAPLLTSLPRRLPGGTQLWRVVTLFFEPALGAECPKEQPSPGHTDGSKKDHRALLDPACPDPSADAELLSVPALPSPLHSAQGPPLPLLRGSLLSAQPCKHASSEHLPSGRMRICLCTHPPGC